MAEIEGHKDPEFYLLGTINFTNSINEQEVVQKNQRFKTKSIGECKVEIYPNEGPVPHMHVYNNDKSFESCICVYSNNYFAHGGKYTSKFSSKQCREFNEWMKNQNTKFPGNITNWQAVAFAWEIANPDCKFPENRKVKTQPHYEDMINFKDK